MIEKAKKKKQRDEKNDKCDNFAQKMRNRFLLAPLKKNAQNLTINKRDDQRCAEKYCRGGDMHPPRRLQSVDSKRDIKCKRETEELIQDSEANFGAPFQKSPKA